MTDPNREESLLRYIAGRCSGGEEARIRTKLEKTERGRGIGAGLRRAMAADVLERGSPDAHVSLDRLMNRLDREILGVSSEAVGWDAGRVRTALPATRRGIVLREGTFKAQPLRRWTWATVAVLTVALAVVMLGWRTRGHTLLGHDMASMSIYTTGNGERANITLPDSSTVVLNVASRLEVPADYAAGHHIVRLVGEALFTVTRHVGTPFTVIAGPATTRVLGTSFVVRHYPSDSTAIVSVRDGKVAVRSLVLTASHEVVVDRMHVLHVGAADPSEFGFVTGVLMFNGMPLRNAIQMLNRWFDADIRLTDSTLGERQVAGEFMAGSLSGLAESLESALDVRVVRAGRVLTVYPR